MSINPRDDPRLAGEVTRYHTWPRLRDQSVAEHSWQLARIVYELYRHMNSGMPARVHEYILFHDVGEIGTGDIPYPIKKNNPALKEIMDELETNTLKDMGIVLPFISDGERRLIKAAELVEMWEWAREEIARGNRFAELVAHRCHQAVSDWYKPNEPEYLALVKYRSKRLAMWDTP